MLLLGRRFNNAKQEHGKHKNRSNQYTKVEKHQNDASPEPAKTAGAIAAGQGVSQATVERAGAKAKKLEQTGLDALVQDGTIKVIN